MLITFTVPGPAVAWKRPGRKRNRYFTQEPVALYQNLVKMQFAAAVKGATQTFPIDSAVSMNLIFGIPIPTSLTKKKRETIANGLLKPVKRPDIDNLTKGILDALNGLAFHDDSQVTHICVTKAYMASPYTTVSLEF